MEPLVFTASIRGKKEKNYVVFFIYLYVKIEHYIVPIKVKEV